MRAFLYTLLLVCALGPARANDLLLGASLEQCKVLYGEPTRLTQRENDTVAIFQRPTYSIDMVIRNGRVERIAYASYHHLGEAFTPLQQDEIFKVLNLWAKGWKPSSESPSWLDFVSEDGQIGQYNRKTKTLFILTPEARRRFREEAGLEPSSKAQSSDEQHQATADSHLPQAERAKEQALDYEKYFKAKMAKLQQLQAIAPQLPLALDIREALAASLQMNLDLLEKLNEVHEKRFGEALVNDLGSVDKQLAEHTEVSQFFKEKSPIVLKAARDAQQIKDPALSQSVYDGLTVASESLSKLMDMHPNPLHSKDGLGKTDATSDFKPISNDKILEAEETFRGSLRKMLGMLTALPATDEDVVGRLHDALSQAASMNELDFGIWSGDDELQNDLKKADTDLLSSLTNAKALNRERSYSQAKLLLRNATSKLRSLTPRIEKAVDHISQIIKTNGDR